MDVQSLICCVNGCFCVHEWFTESETDPLTNAIYILKELIDNALDADETLWLEDSGAFPSLQIHMEYIDVPERRSKQLFVQVSNRAKFPVEQIENIFATQWYTSRKTFIKGLTRGALEIGRASCRERV